MAIKFIDVEGLKLVWKRINDVFVKKSDVPDLSNVALKSDIPDIGVLVSDIEAIGVKVESAAEQLLRKADKSEIPDIRGLALKSEIPDISGKANTGDSYTKAQSDAKYLTQHQDISGLALKSDIPDISGKADRSEIPDISGKANMGDSYTKSESDGRYAQSGRVEELASALSDHDLLVKKADKTYSPAGGTTTSVSFTDTVPSGYKCVGVFCYGTGWGGIYPQATQLTAAGGASITVYNSGTSRNNISISVCLVCIKSNCAAFMGW